MKKLYAGYTPKEKKHIWCSSCFSTFNRQEKMTNHILRTRKEKKKVETSQGSKKH